MPGELRQLFTMILIWGTPRSPLQLWERFKENMAEDYLRRFGPEVSIQLVYNDINERLGYFRKLLSSDFNVPLPPPNQGAQIINPNRINTDNEAALGEQMYYHLNQSQTIIADQVFSAIHNAGINKLFFIDGPGGSG